jgi:hypothetical protein
MHLLTASTVTLTLIVTAAGLTAGTRSSAGDISAKTTPEIAGLDFDIGNFATDAVWAQYVAKGDHLECVMDATDAGAGYLIQDTRQPPSAASPWTSDLRRMRNRPSELRVLVDICRKSCQVGLARQRLRQGLGV